MKTKIHTLAFRGLEERVQIKSIEKRHLPMKSNGPHLTKFFPFISILLLLLFFCGTGI
jgi:hypothetical protein